MTKFTNCHPICFAIFISVAIINQINGAVLRDDRGPVLNVAVIGAGTAGLASAKYSLAHGYNVTIFEQTEKIGGAWVYTNKTGKDQYGVNIHSAMYQGLRYFDQNMIILNLRCDVLHNQSNLFVLFDVFFLFFYSL